MLKMCAANENGSSHNNFFPRCHFTGDDISKLILRLLGFGTILELDPGFVDNKETLILSLVFQVMLLAQIQIVERVLDDFDQLIEIKVW